jgi:hypothetical protein
VKVPIPPEFSFPAYDPTVVPVGVVVPAQATEATFANPELLMSAVEQSFEIFVHVAVHVTWPTPPIAAAAHEHWPFCV